MMAAYEYIQSCFVAEDVYTQGLCTLRNYFYGKNEAQERIIRELKIGICGDNLDLDVLKDMGCYELGLITTNNFLLSGRYIIPVYDIGNNLVSLIGYFPNDRKYMTVPGPWFSKNILFFNYRQAYELSWKEYNGLVFVVEGIFDCLSLRSIGLPCIATMGSTVSETKRDLLKLFNKVIAIPDNDDVGRRSISRNSEQGWKVPENATFLRFHGETTIDGVTYHCKDMDNLVTMFDEESVRLSLLDFRNCKEAVADFYL